MDYEFVKRVIDVILAFFLGIVFLPVILLTGALIKLTSPGPVFADTPKRVGRRGKRFRLYKFRSMIAGAHTLLTTDPAFSKLYEQYKKQSYKHVEGDPRVTAFGRLIRKYSIDEIPQLLNVIKGEMSLVGPRPYYKEELEEQQRRYPKTKKMVKIALSARPGITGLWQVSGRSQINFDKRIALDAQYAENKSFWLDLKILFKTPLAMVSGQGAV